MDGDRPEKRSAIAWSSTADSTATPLSEFRMSIQFNDVALALAVEVFNSASPALAGEGVASGGAARVNPKSSSR